MCLCLQTFESFSILLFISHPIANPSINPIFLSLKYTQNVASSLVITLGTIISCLEYCTSFLSGLSAYLLPYHLFFKRTQNVLSQIKPDHVLSSAESRPPPLNPTILSRAFRIMAHLLLMLQGSSCCTVFLHTLASPSVSPLQPHPLPKELVLDS